MATLDELGRLTDDESADLLDRVGRFRSAWKADGSPRLSDYLPPSGSRHRSAVLVQVITADMECRAAAGQPFRAERYVNHFPEELSTTDMPVPLLAAEFRLRHRYTDKPALVEYQRWFPAQFDALVAHLAELPPLPSAGPGDLTPVTGVKPPPDANPTPGGPRPSTLNDGRRAASPPPAAVRMSGLAVTGPIEAGVAVGAAAAARAAANMDRLGIPYDVLPSDAPYQLVRRIGSGAFGEVFEALAPGGVKVAVKRILRTVDHPASKSEREALEAIKWLSHPFLVKTNAYWVFDDKLVIVMELADGSLTDRIVYHQDRGLPGVPPEELIPFFEQAGEALDYLHSQSVSHRDVKPENLLIQKGYAKVADFGLARLHEHAMTMVPNTVGTPAYMAPEMWQQKVSLQSDQYSLAATYVRARLGRHLFDTNILVDMANSHINATPDLNPLPEAEKAVLLKALAKKPDDRYPSCLAFAKALRAAVFPPPPPPKPEPLPPREGRGILVQTVIGAVVTALAVGLVLWFMIPRPEVAKQDGKSEKEPEKTIPKVLWCPEGWQAINEMDTRVTSPSSGGKEYYNRLTHKDWQNTLVAILILPSQSNQRPYYMLENKITNRVFKTVWDDIADESEVLGIRQTRKLATGRWRRDESENALDIEGRDAELPVLGVTVPEAMLVARKLGGSLPTFQQWLKATGIQELGVKTGPAGAAVQRPAQFVKAKLSPDEAVKYAAWKKEQFADKQLALGLPDRPLAVTDPRAGRDASCLKIRQLVSNGQEWLRHDRKNIPLTLSPLPLTEPDAGVVGRGPRDAVIDTVAYLRDEMPGEYPWDTAGGDGFVGFRLVLEVP